MLEGSEVFELQKGFESVGPNPGSRMPHEAPRVLQVAVRLLDERGGLGLDLRGVCV